MQRWMVPVVLAGALWQCRSSGPSDAAFPIAVLGACIRSGTQVTVRLPEPIDTTRAKAGDAIVGSLDEPVRGADGRVVLPAGTPVRGRIVAVEKGRFARAQVEVDRVDTPQGPRVMHGRATSVPIAPPSAPKPASLPKTATMTVVVIEGSALDEAPPPPATALVCDSFAEIAAGSELSVRFEDGIEPQRSRAGQLVRTVLLRTISDTRGRALVPAGAHLDLAITRVDVGRAPAVHLAFRSLETPFGDLSVHARAREGLERYATIEPVGSARAGTFALLPAKPATAVDAGAPSEEAAPSALHVPIGAEMLVELVEPLRIALPTR